MSPISDIRELQNTVRSTLKSTPNGDEVLFSRILDDLRQSGGDFAKHAALIMELVKDKVSGKPMDDRTMIMERMIQLVAALPDASFARKKVTDILVGQLWDSMKHPPLCSIGNLYQHRQPDGSHNNAMHPNLGKTGTPYARTVRTTTKAHGARPDPGLLFDLLMSRGDTFEENAAGISTMLLYHASIITHDIFNTSRAEQSINKASSYLDLAPLYGSSIADLCEVRTFSNGELKPDSFSDKRLLAFPPGVSVLLIMYCRFHNFVARTLATINEGERFTPPPHLHGREERLEWADEQIFQVARLVTNGLYVNISLHDYLRAIANVNSTESSWTLDPRGEINKGFSEDGVPRGTGNQVSYEFNLLYRFHSAISDRDARWTKDFYATLLPNENVDQVPLPKLLQAMHEFFENGIPKDPSMRTFENLKRGPEGMFNDEDLVRILKQSIEDPAGRFGANHVPDILKPVEILGIMQARKWQAASLNEFRHFFKLKQYETFEDINPDPYVADTLKRLYSHPDNVEMYPGMFLEACKPRMDPGMGLCAPYTVTRAVFSDAITLVRSDRFLTLDYTPANLTNWGITEVAQDLDILGGAKMYQLILNAFPRYFKFNSVYAMQPFYTPAESKNIFTKSNTTHLYSFDSPSLEPPIISITNHAALKTVLCDKNNFKVPWGPKMASLERYMLSADLEANTVQRKLVSGILYEVDGAMEKVAAYTEQITLELLKRQSYPLGRKNVYQVDIVKDIGNLVALHFGSQLCHLPLLSQTSPSYSEAELYKILCDITTYIFSDADSTKSWVRRRDAEKGSAKLCSDVEKIVKVVQPVFACPALPPPPHGKTPRKTLVGNALRNVAEQASTNTILGSAVKRMDNRVDSLIDGVRGRKTVATTPWEEYEIVDPLSDYGEKFAGKLLGAGKTAREAAEILVGTASAFVANTATAFAQLVDFYLESKNAAHWSVIQQLSVLNTPAADHILAKYVLEGFRLSNSLGISRIVQPASGKTVSIAQNGKTITAKGGDRVFLSFVAASRDPSVFPCPEEVHLDRPYENYVTFGEGPHQCLGKDINIVYSLTMLKVLARLKGLRRTPGDEGRLKCINKPGGIKLYMTPDWSKCTPYPTTMKLMWDGPP